MAPPAQAYNEAWFRQRIADIDTTITSLSDLAKRMGLQSNLFTKIKSGGQRPGGLALGEVVALAQLLRTSVNEVMREGLGLAAAGVGVDELIDLDPSEAAQILKDENVKLPPNVNDLLEEAKARNESPAYVLKTAYNIDWPRPRVRVEGAVGRRGHVTYGRRGDVTGPPHTSAITRALVVSSDCEATELVGGYLFYADRDSVDADALRQGCLAVYQHLAPRHEATVGRMRTLIQPNVVEVIPVGGEQPIRLHLARAACVTWIKLRGTDA